MALAAVCLLAFALRVLQLDFQPLWWDEGWSLYFAAADVGSMLRLTAVDIHPPLYYLLLRLWQGAALLGSGPAAIRFLSVIVGTATVPVMYVTGRRLLGEKGGLLAALLLAVSPFHIYYSQEVRMYGLLTLLGLLALYAALRLEELPHSLWVWLGYVGAATAALYTEYYAAALLLGLNVAMVVHWARKRRPWAALWPWWAAQAAVALLYLPWVWYAGGKLLIYVQYKVGAEGDAPLGLFLYLGRQLAALAWGHTEGPLAAMWWLGLVALAVPALCVAWLLFAGRRGAHRAGARPRGETRAAGWWPEAVAILATGLVCGFVANLAFPFVAPRTERQLLFLLPVAVLLLTAALLALWERRRLWAVLSAAVLLAAAGASLAFFYTTDRYPDDDYRPIAAQMRALARPGDALLAVHPWQVGYFQAYLPPALRPEMLLTPRQAGPREGQLWADDPGRMAADLQALLAEHGRVWFPAHQAMGQVLEEPITAYLAGHAYPALSKWANRNTVLSLFSAGSPVAQSVTGRFGSWLTLEGAALSATPLEAGRGVAAVDLSWKVSEHPSEPYTVGLRLVDRAGRIWAQRDASPAGGLLDFGQWPPGQAGLDRHGLLVPAGTPPGDFRVMLRVYNSADQSVLPVTFDGRSEGSGGEVELGTVHVVRPEAAPPVEALDVDRPASVDFGSKLRFLGFDPPSDAPTPLLPGEAVAVDLYWQAIEDPGEDFLPRLQLLDSDGAVVAESDPLVKPVGGAYPTAWWQAGELVRDPHELTIPAAMPPGRYRLALSLVRAAAGLPVETESGGASLDLFDVQVQGREHSFEPPQPLHAQRVVLSNEGLSAAGQAQGEAVELAGYDLEDRAWAPGSALPLTLHWRAHATPDRNYHAFVHLLDESGSIVAQHDGVPGEGRLPTRGWLPGEAVADAHTLQLPLDLPAGDYRLEVGLYDPVTDERLGQPVGLDTVVRVRDG